MSKSLLVITDDSPKFAKNVLSIYLLRFVLLFHERLLLKQENDVKLLQAFKTRKRR